MSDRPDPPQLWMACYSLSVMVALFARSMRNGTPVRAEVDEITEDAKRIADVSTKAVLQKFDHPPAYFAPPRA